MRDAVLDRVDPGRWLEKNNSFFRLDSVLFLRNRLFSS